MDRKEGREEERGVVFMDPVHTRSTQGPHDLSMVLNSPKPPHQPLNSFYGWA